MKVLGPLTPVGEQDEFPTSLLWTGSDLAFVAIRGLKHYMEDLSLSLKPQNTLSSLQIGKPKFFKNGNAENIGQRRRHCGAVD